jgi:urease accessory protein
MATGTSTIAITGTTMAEGALFDLLSWMSPAWPIGAFAHSSGLEWAVEAGHVTDRASTQAWIGDLIDHGGLWNDAVIFTFSHRASAAGDGQRLAEIAELAVAMLTSHERHLEATAQGAAFRRIAASTASVLSLALLAEIEDEELSYPVAAACMFAGHGIALAPALTAFLHGAAANLVSAAQRLVPLGQTDGQLVLRALRDPILEAAKRAGALPDGDPFEAMGGACLSADIACMAHETQYTRLFRT